jgi:hypothetical protein
MELGGSGTFPDHDIGRLTVSLVFWNVRNSNLMFDSEFDGLLRPPPLDPSAPEWITDFSSTDSFTTHINRKTLGFSSVPSSYFLPPRKFPTATRVASGICRRYRPGCGEIPADPLHADTIMHNASKLQPRSKGSRESQLTAFVSGQLKWANHIHSTRMVQRLGVKGKPQPIEPFVKPQNRCLRKISVTGAPQLIMIGRKQLLNNY